MQEQTTISGKLYWHATQSSNKSHNKYSETQTIVTLNTAQIHEKQITRITCIKYNYLHISSSELHWLKWCWSNIRLFDMSQPRTIDVIQHHFDQHNFITLVINREGHPLCFPKGEYSSSYPPCLACASNPYKGYRHAECMAYHHRNTRLQHKPR